MRSEQGKQKKPIKMSTALLILAIIAAAVVLAVVIVTGMSGSEEMKNWESIPLLTSSCRTTAMLCFSGLTRKIWSQKPDTAVTRLLFSV